MSASCATTPARKVLDALLNASVLTRDTKFYFVPGNAAPGIGCTICDRGVIFET